MPLDLARIAFCFAIPVFAPELLLSSRLRLRAQHFKNKGKCPPLPVDPTSFAAFTLSRQMEGLKGR